MIYDTITKKFTGQPATGITCWCGLQFAIPSSLYGYYERKNDETPGSFSLWCPIGHSMIPSDPHALSNRLKDELAREKHRAEQAVADAQWARERRAMTERQLSAKKGQLTKLRKRVGNGVCPCCNRYFANLHSHITGQHPEFRADEDASPVVAPAADVPTWADLKAKRVALGLSTAAVAEAVGLKRSSLAIYEYGYKAVPRVARKVAAYLEKASQL